LYVSESFQNYSFISFESAVKKYSRIAQLGEKLFHLETLAWRRRRQLSGGNVANGCKPQLVIKIEYFASLTKGTFASKVITKIKIKS